MRYRLDGFLKLMPTHMESDTMEPALESSSAWANKLRV